MAPADRSAHYASPCFWFEVERPVVGRVFVAHRGRRRVLATKLADPPEEPALSVEGFVDYMRRKFGVSVEQDRGPTSPWPFNEVREPFQATDLVDLSTLTDRQREVMEATAHIPSGQYRTYGQIAGEMVPPSSARAVGQAMKRNPAPLIIPCHRVVAKGELGGWDYGPDLKRELLAHEGVHLPKIGARRTRRHALATTTASSVRRPSLAARIRGGEAEHTEFKPHAGLRTGKIALLGIDAAWTYKNPSGVSLLTLDERGDWRCAALAPSYGAFLDLAAGTPVDWESPPTGGSVEAGELLSAARALGADSVEVVAIDMPLSLLPITGRRPADTAVSRAFSARGAPADTPSAERPGPLSDSLRADFAAHNYPLATKIPAASPQLAGLTSPVLIEVYPHVSLLDLTNADYRLRYKVKKSLKYWPDADFDERIGLLLAELAFILECLRQHLRGIELELPVAAEVPTFEALKRYEDAIDSLVCAWSALCYWRGEADAYGDETGAIWVPRTAA